MLPKFLLCCLVGCTEFNVSMRGRYLLRNLFIFIIMATLYLKLLANSIIKRRGGVWKYSPTILHQKRMPGLLPILLQKCQLILIVLSVDLPLPKIILKACEMS